MTGMGQAERPKLRRWSRGEYARLIDHGFLDEDEPIELLDGLLLVKEPQHSPHRTAVLLTAKALERAFGEGWFVQTQSPIILDDRSEPEPDVCVVRGSPRDYVAAHPRQPGSSSRSPNRACISPVDGKPRPMRVPESQTTGSSTWSIVCWRCIGNQGAPIAGGGAMRRSRLWERMQRHQRLLLREELFE